MNYLFINSKSTDFMPIVCQNLYCIYRQQKSNFSSLTETSRIDPQYLINKNTKSIGQESSDSKDAKKTI